jgi:outer membrane protein
MKKALKVLPQFAALSLLAAFSLPASAQTAGSNIVNLGWFHINPHDSSETLKLNGSPVPGSSASVSDSDTVGIALTHFFTDNVALTFDAGIPPKYKLKAGGTISALGELGTAKQWSPALVAKWFFGNADSAFRPFIGAGVTYVKYSDVQLSQSFQQAVGSGNGQIPGGSYAATAQLSSSWAPVANIGATYNFDKNWSLGLSVSYIPLKTNADITGTNAANRPVTGSTTLTINPLVTFLSVGYRF